jgi:hypothetical protein
MTSSITNHILSARWRADDQLEFVFGTEHYFAVTDPVLRRIQRPVTARIEHSVLAVLEWAVKYKRLFVTERVAFSEPNLVFRAQEWDGHTRRA